MQHVSALYEEIFRSRKYYVETSLVVGERGKLITERAEYILFGGHAILVSNGGADDGYGETMIISIKTTGRVFKNNVPEVGCCPCGEIYVEMHQPRGFIERRGMVVPYIRLVSTVDGRKSEWVRKGVYYVDTRDNTNNDDNLDILSLHGYDGMMFAEQQYGEFFQEDEFTITDWTKANGVYTAYVNDSSVVSTKDISIEYTGADSVAFGQTVSYEQQTGKVKFTTRSSPPPNLFGKIVIRDKETIGFPAKDIDVVMDIARKMGVSVDTRSIAQDNDRNPLPKADQPYINKEYIVQYPAEYTFREVLGYIGAMYGGNWIMNDAGDLQFIPLWDLPEESNLLIDDLGYYITFGGYRIRLTARR